MSKLFITCALPYANGPTHLGHLRSTYIPADIYARYNRMKGNEVLFVCSTDEHGTPIAVKAEKEGKKPLEIATRYHNMIKEDLHACHISFDNFSRTTDSLHYEISQNFFLKLYEKGFIYEKEIKQPYCDRCGRFLPDRYVEGICPHCDSEGARGDHCEVCGRHLEPTQLVEPQCLICNSKPEIKESKHYFFKLSHFENDVHNWIISNKELPANVKNYALQWIKEGLKDWILTRDMEWGIPVPLDGAEGKIIYVWGEAFLGYISSAAQWSGKTGKLWKEYWDEKAVHFIGKDIIYHHSIFWPALLMAYGCKLPKNIIAGEYLSLEGSKMSTSKNWVIWTSDFLKNFDADVLRYYLTINAPLTRDTDFSWDDFQRRVNDELADVLGNFIHRTFSFTKRFFNGEIPEATDFSGDDLEFEQSIKEAPLIIGNLIEEYKFREALVNVIKLAKKGNKYFNDQEPWKTVKEDPEKAANCLYLCNQLTKVLAIFLIPYMPEKSLQILETLNLSTDNIVWDNTSSFIPSGHKIKKAKPLFAKIDDEFIEKQKEDLYKNLEEEVHDSSEDNEMTEIVSIDDFAKLEFRIGKVIEAESVEGSDNLLKLQVDIKEKQIQVVAGIAKKYSDDEILNKKVVVLVNLAPAKLFGVKSEGMILATSDSLSILSSETAAIGERIK
ncbi:methionine--tRNA ligase [Methanobacterium alcaliphilum]|uniref:methionine--tRNA ligase n=1 Tax=Methanobacterium alcaliphilum TaxID=392018 RepID=UPI00200A2B20|nr:methionine--tRNA ligase [Methanobacterium alcaliphilum]MCK9152488.1 methionine--tRNA ligase [Methanobacterium alcaliphilum]